MTRGRTLTVDVQFRALIAVQCMGVWDRRALLLPSLPFGFFASQIVLGVSAASCAALRCVHEEAHVRCAGARDSRPRRQPDYVPAPVAQQRTAWHSACARRRDHRQSPPSRPHPRQRRSLIRSQTKPKTFQPKPENRPHRRARRTNGALRRARPPPRRGAALPTPRISQFAPPLPLLHSPRRPDPRLRLPATAVAASSPPEAQAAAAAEEEDEQGEKRRKLYVANLPWSFPAPEIEKLFAQCGVVKDVEVIKGKDGRKKGLAFVTMSTAEEVAAAVEKLNSHDVMGRTIKVEFSKSFRKPAPPPPPGTMVERHKLHVSNLTWKERSLNMKEFFSEFNPFSAKVVFDSPSGKSAGYGFVSFGTKEEAEAALSELDGKELMGRPVRLRWQQRVDNKVEGVKADGEVEGVKVDGEAEGAMVDNGGEDGGDDNQE